MPSSMRPKILSEKSCELSLKNPPFLLRASEKHKPKQSDFPKEIASAILSAEQAGDAPLFVLVGGVVESADIERIASFLSEKTTITAFLSNRHQFADALTKIRDYPAVVTQCSAEFSVEFEKFASLATSLNHHSQSFGQKLLERHYGLAKSKLETLHHRKAEFVFEEKFGKIVPATFDESTLKERGKFFSRGGLDWRKTGDDHDYFSQGWALSFFSAIDPSSAGASVRKMKLDFLEMSFGSEREPTLQTLKAALDTVATWCAEYATARALPKVDRVCYCLPSVPVAGWIGDHLEHAFGHKLEHYLPSLLWGWHPTADFIEFLGLAHHGVKLFLGFEAFPRISAVMMYEERDAH